MVQVVLVITVMLHLVVVVINSDGGGDGVVANRCGSCSCTDNLMVLMMKAIPDLTTARIASDIRKFLSSIFSSDEPIIIKFFLLQMT